MWILKGLILIAMMGIMFLFGYLTAKHMCLRYTAELLYSILSHQGISGQDATNKFDEWIADFMKDTYDQETDIEYENNDNN